MYPLGALIDNKTGIVDGAIFGDVSYERPFVVVRTEQGELQCGYAVAQAARQEAKQEFKHTANCPNCGFEMAGTTCTSTGMQSQPKPGDVTVCPGCAWLLGFRQDMTLSVPGPQEFLDLVTNSEMLEAVMHTSAKLVLDRMAEKIGVDTPWKKAVDIAHQQPTC